MVAQEMSGKIDYNMYYDTREFFQSTILTSVQFTDRLSYFSMANFNGNHEQLDVANLYMEHNLRFQIIPALDFAAQYDIISNDHNDKIRLGIRVKANQINGISDFLKKINFFYSASIYIANWSYSEKGPVMFNQIEHAYRLNLLKGKIYLSGFADQNFIDKSLKTEYVTEHQLGIKLYKAFYAVAEYRYHDYMAQKEGVGIGLEYVVDFN